MHALGAAFFPAHPWHKRGPEIERYHENVVSKIANDLVVATPLPPKATVSTLRG
jgi:hypothetical protein